MYIYFFDSIGLLGDSTLFKWILPLGKSFLFYKGRLRIHSLKGIFDIRRKWKKETLPGKGQPYLVIHDSWTTNFYHWMTQALPRLVMAQQTGHHFTLLLPADHNTEFHVQSLRLLGVEDWETIAPRDHFYRVSQLLYPGKDIEIGNYSHVLIEKLSAKMHSLGETDLSAKIFIHRRSAAKRRIINEEEVLRIFTSFGFSIVEYELLSFMDQLKLSGTASVLAGVHGAGLTQMMFMSQGSKVFELTTRIHEENFYYFSLSQVFSHAYYYQLCRPGSAGTTIQDADLLVDESLLKENLALILAP